MILLTFRLQALELCRIKYQGGGDWYNDPEVLPNLAREITKRTGIKVSEQQRELDLSDQALFSCPFLFLTGHGNIKLDGDELERLRKYLENGGFLYADDDYGMDQSFRLLLKKVFPDKELLPLPADHAIYKIFYRLEGLPKIHVHDGKPPQGFGIFEKGKMVVFYTYESNISDGWADPGTHNDPENLREQSFQMGVNIFYYALCGSE
ncbi:MAG: DUF4159 domain-containing protein [Candidatus Wallbacteria bacterium]|nr:DUF4159 domain-containing protein [Candidatus Wallbacteria bacterium]